MTKKFINRVLLPNLVTFLPSQVKFTILSLISKEVICELQFSMNKNVLVRQHIKIYITKKHYHTASHIKCFL